MISHVVCEADRVELMRLEEAMWRAETRFDLGFQRERFAPDFFEFGRSGRVYCRQQVVSVPSQEIRAVLPLANLAIRLLDRDTAQLTYDSQVKYGEATEHSRRSSIWLRTSSGWVMRFHQGTPFVPAGAPNDG